MWLDIITTIGIGKIDRGVDLTHNSVFNSNLLYIYYI